MRSPESELISVVVPTFNYARYLSQTLDSALNQTGVSLEVIVVDDGSTDATPEILEGFGSEIRLLRQNNHGLSAARNAALSLAEGEYIVFLDADDLLPPEALASQNALLQADPDLDMVICRSFLFEKTDNTGQPLKTGKWRLFCKDIDVHLCHFNIAPPHALMFRRRALDLAGSFDTSLKACEDHDMWFRVAFNGAKFEINPYLEVPYRRHPGSMSQHVENQWLHDAEVHLRIARALKDTPFPRDRRVEGLLACVAGCLLTAGRLEEKYGEISERLRRQAMETARLLPPKSQGVGSCSITRDFFLLRIAMTLAIPFRNGAAWAKDLAVCLGQNRQTQIGPLLDLKDNEIEASVEQKMYQMTC
jgi:GT2 family glycosyltransferase